MKKHEDDPEKKGQLKQREEQQVKKEIDEKESQVLTQPDFLDNNIERVQSQAIIRINSTRGLLDYGYCEEQQSTRRELLLDVQPLDLRLNYMSLCKDISPQHQEAKC